MNKPTFIIHIYQIDALFLLLREVSSEFHVRLLVSLYNLFRATFIPLLIIGRE
jgi:hypothetical protein